MENKWHEVWERRKSGLATIDMNNHVEVFADLKKINGFDITNGGIPLSSLIQQYKDTKQSLKIHSGQSIF